MNRAFLIPVALFALAGSRSMAQETPPPDRLETRPPQVHQLRWIPAGVMREVLGGSGSSDFILFGDERARLWTNQRLNTISLQGSPAFAAFVAAMIKQFDVEPSAIEFDFHVLRASTGEAGLKDGLPPFVRKVVEEIGSLTRYNRFELIDSPVLRTTAGDRGHISGQGTLAYEINLRPAQVVGEGPVRRIRVDDCIVQYRIFSDRTAGVTNSFTIADGETIVLGASRIPQSGPAAQNGDWAIVTVVTANILK